MPQDFCDTTLDDAAFFAANSVGREVFVLTTAFTTYNSAPRREYGVTPSAPMRAPGKERAVPRHAASLLLEIALLFLVVASCKRSQRRANATVFAAGCTI